MITGSNFIKFRFRTAFLKEKKDLIKASLNKYSKDIIDKTKASPH